MNKIYIPLLVALSLVVSLFERLIPIPIPVPGSKLGLANIILLTSLICFGFRDTLIINILKSILFMLFMGTPVTFIYSIAGGLISLIMMYIASKYIKQLSLIGISFIGAFFHILSQLMVAALILNNWRILIYLPYLVMMSVFSGYFVGLSATHLIPAIKRIRK